MTINATAIAAATAAATATNPSAQQPSSSSSSSSQNTSSGGAPTSSGVSNTSSNSSSSSGGGSSRSNGKKLKNKENRAMSVVNSVVSTNGITNGVIGAPTLLVNGQQSQLKENHQLTNGSSGGGGKIGSTGDLNGSGTSEDFILLKDDLINRFTQFFLLSVLNCIIE